MKNEAPGERFGRGANPVPFCALSRAAGPGPLVFFPSDQA
jgi:hypothetical protein